MKIALANDHAAVAAKLAILEHLKARGHEALNLGTDAEESTDYPDLAGELAHRVASGECERGILLCGTGIGVSIAANKVRGIRAALCHSTQTAAMAREHNDANVLCLGARVLETGEILACVDRFLATRFAGGRHQRRIDKITALEAGEA